jgi:hypothetical protein
MKGTTSLPDEVGGRRRPSAFIQTPWPETTTPRRPSSECRRRPPTSSVGGHGGIAELARATPAPRTARTRGSLATARAARKAPVKRLAD